MLAPTVGLCGFEMHEGLFTGVVVEWGVLTLMAPDRALAEG